MMQSILIVGAGRLGTSLYLGLKKFLKGNVTIYNRRPLPEEYNHIFYPEPVLTSLNANLIEKNDTFFICVQDSNIAEVVLLFQHYNLAGKHILHTSGINDSSILDNLKQAGAFIGSWHPVQTFNTCFSDPEIWKQIICTYQGDPEIVNSLKNLTENLGAEFLEVNMDQKKSIHLSAVIAANYQVGLMALACDILEQAEIGDKTGKKLLYPLIRQVLDNFYNFPVHSILTGPLVRGDIESISDHLRILENSSNPESIQLYKSMARHIINDSKFKIPETKNLKHLLEQ